MVPSIDGHLGDLEHHRDVPASGALPAAAKSRNEYLAEVEDACEASPESCGAILETALAEMVEVETDLAGLATFTAKIVERATEAAVAAGGSVASVASVAKAATAATGSIKAAAEAKG